jgi:hypothetical protein
MLCHLFLAFSLSALFSLGKQIKVNLQWSICDTNSQAVLQKLGEDGAREPYKKTPVTYYDTNPPLYVWGGLMFRTKTRRGEELSAIKVHFDPGIYIKCPRGLLRRQGSIYQRKNIRDTGKIPLRLGSVRQ